MPLGYCRILIGIYPGICQAKEGKDGGGDRGNKTDPGGNDCYHRSMSLWSRIRGKLIPRLRNENRDHNPDVNL